MTIIFGPAGIGTVHEAAANLEKYHKLGLGACEIPFTYSIFIKEDKHAKEIVEIRKVVEKLKFKLSIHAPYWVNLNSVEKEKIEGSKKRILDCCKIGELIGAYRVVFHCGFYGKMTREETYENIKKAVSEVQEQIKKNKWKIKIAAETMGKINIFGSPEEIKKLSKETGCEMCVDFAHLLARNIGKKSYKELYADFKEYDNLHCHFSGINFGDKGEISHKPTPDEEIKKLLEALPKNKNFVIINESHDPLGDSIKSLKIYNEL